MADGFQVDPDALDALADQVGPLGPALRNDATTGLDRANQAGRGNAGYYTSVALDFACQQLRATFSGIATQVTGYQRAAKANADNYRSGDARVRRHLEQFFERL
jgi:hypothetical protein